MQKDKANEVYETVKYIFFIKLKNIYICYLEIDTIIFLAELVVQILCTGITF